jgi:hypothetical protein
MDLAAIMIRQLIGLTAATCFATSTFAAETQALKIYSAAVHPFRTPNGAHI